VVYGKFVLIMLAERLAPALATKTSPLTLKRADGYRPKLLLAEDSDPVRVVTAAMLKGMGCDVDAVVHGEEAVKSAAASRFDVIVLDIEMPVMDGKEATRIIRHEKQTGYSTIPIIALTADATSETQNTINQFGFNQYLSKPFMPDALYRLLKKYYNQYEKQINN